MHHQIVILLIFRVDPRKLFFLSQQFFRIFFLFASDLILKFCVICFLIAGLILCDCVWVSILRNHLRKMEKFVRLDFIIGLCGFFFCKTIFMSTLSSLQKKNVKTFFLYAVNEFTRLK